MTIGLPKALLYYRFEHLWKTFFNELGCDVVTSSDTCQTMLMEGIAQSVSECCLPVKLFMGHIATLVGRCDHILVPRFESLGKNEEFCVRFLGLPDIVRNSFPDSSLISYNLQGHKRGSERHGFLHMGKCLGKSSTQALQAYHHAIQEQQRQDRLSEERQRELFSSCAPRILLVSHPYIIHDAYVGAPLLRMLREQGGVPIFADHCNHLACRSCSKLISTDLYWTLSKEIIGAIPLTKNNVDGVLLVTAFPCGTDSLVNELVLRRVRDFPVAQIVLDEQQGEAGLQTRIECFMDILYERRHAHAQ
jgi:predicted nucleotide-binding protein (sugar kinase/HSP70/actin superfamily)